MEEHNIKDILQTGDLFDRRKYINFNSMYLAKKYLFDPMYVKDITFHTLIGNHDVYFRDKLDVNSTQLLLDGYDNIFVYDRPTTVSFGGAAIDIIPWICDDNEQQIKQFINNSKSTLCIGHFELSGFEMYIGSVFTGGMDRSELSKYDMVFSGHFHHKSSTGNINYVGTPYELTWADYNDPRGFHVFDTSTRDLIFIENPFKLFHKIIYDGDQETKFTIRSKQFSRYNETIVKVIATNKKNVVLFDSFMDLLYKVGPFDVSIVEDFVDYSSVAVDDVVDQSDDAITSIEKYIDNIGVSLDKQRLKNYMRTVYTESQNLQGI